jgi:hypothetical protein
VVIAALDFVDLARRADGSVVTEFRLLQVPAVEVK